MLWTESMLARIPRVVLGTSRAVGDKTEAAEAEVAGPSLATRRLHLSLLPQQKPLSHRRKAVAGAEGTLSVAAAAKAPHARGKTPALLKLLAMEHLGQAPGAVALIAAAAAAARQVHHQAPLPLPQFRQTRRLQRRLPRRVSKALNAAQEAHSARLAAGLPKLAEAQLPVARQTPKAEVAMARQTQGNRLPAKSIHWFLAQATAAPAKWTIDLCQTHGSLSCLLFVRLAPHMNARSCACWMLDSNVALFARPAF